jgi:hypothetical protein
MRSRPLNVGKPIDYFCRALARAHENAISECSGTLIPRRVQRAKFTKAARYRGAVHRSAITFVRKGSKAVVTPDHGYVRVSPISRPLLADLALPRSARRRHSGHPLIDAFRSFNADACVTRVDAFLLSRGTARASPISDSVAGLTSKLKRSGRSTAAGAERTDEPVDEHADARRKPAAAGIEQRYRRRRGRKFSEDGNKCP